MFAFVTKIYQNSHYVLYMHADNTRNFFQNPKILYAAYTWARIIRNKLGISCDFKRSLYDFSAVEFKF